MSRLKASLVVVTAALFTAVGCAVPRTQVGAVSEADVRREQLEQLRLAAELDVANQQRVDRLAAPLLRAAAPLCTKGAKKPSRSDGAPSLVPPSTTPCSFAIIVPHKDQLNAAADGSRIYVATGMLRFANDDELSVVLAHEIAHNAMRHRDAQMKNMLGGALLGAIADIAMAAGGQNTGGKYSQMGAEAGAQAFSQDFEREADYVGQYILAWAGLPVDNAARFWRRMAVEHPTGIVFATTHPTTAERFVRLAKWASEVNTKLASGDAFGPEMKDQRLAVASRANGTPQRSVSGGDVALARAPERAASPALGTDAGPKVSFAPQPSPVGTTAFAAPKERTSPPATTAASVIPESDDERFARATIGAPRSESDRQAAVPAFQRGMEFLGSHAWGRAKEQLKLALQLDGSVAAYHAALGEVLVVEEDWAGAAAEFMAALLLDVDNAEYRARLREARARR